MLYALSGESRGILTSYSAPNRHEAYPLCTQHVPCVQTKPVSWTGNASQGAAKACPSDFRSAAQEDAKRTDYSKSQRADKENQTPVRSTRDEQQAELFVSNHSIDKLQKFFFSYLAAESILSSVTMFKIYDTLKQKLLKVWIYE